MDAERIGLMVLAVALDSVLGGTLVGRLLPSVDRWIFWCQTILQSKLDKANRSKGARRMRGAAVLLIMASLGWAIGTALDRSSATHTVVGQVMSLIVLSALMGQRSVWDMVLNLGKALDDPAHQAAPARMGVARWGAERVALRFADALVANGLIFLLSGFAGLLAFRALSTMMAAGSPSGLIAPKSPYFTAATAAFQGVSGATGLFGAVLLGLGSLFAPGSSIRAFNGSQAATKTKGLIWARALALGTFAHAFDLNFKQDPAVKGPENWIGPTDGRARLMRADLRKLVLSAALGTAIVVLLLLIGLSIRLTP